MMVAPEFPETCFATGPTWCSVRLEQVVSERRSGKYIIRQEVITQLFWTLHFALDVPRYIDCSDWGSHPSICLDVATDPPAFESRRGLHGLHPRRSPWAAYTDASRGWPGATQPDDPLLGKARAIGAAGATESSILQQDSSHAVAPTYSMTDRDTGGRPLHVIACDQTGRWTAANTVG